MTNINRRLVLIISALATLLVSACALIPGNHPPPQLYELTATSEFNKNTPAVPWQLVIQSPTASAGLNDTRIALQRRKYEMSYFEKANWIDRAPSMVQRLVVESFENSGRIAAVGRESLGLRADFALKIELRDFQADYIESDNPSARVAISVKLIRMPKRKIVGSWSHESLVVARDSRLEAIVEAFDQSLDEVMQNLITWVLLQGQTVTQTETD